MFALMADMPAYCPITDALVGSRQARMNSNTYESYGLVARLADKLTEGTDGEWQGYVLHLPSGLPVHKLIPYAPGHVEVVDDGCLF